MLTAGSAGPGIAHFVGEDARDLLFLNTPVRRCGAISRICPSFYSRGQQTHRCGSRTPSPTSSQGRLSSHDALLHEHYFGSSALLAEGCSQSDRRILGLLLSPQLATKHPCKQLSHLFTVKPEGTAHDSKRLQVLPAPLRTFQSSLLSGHFAAKSVPTSRLGAPSLGRC